MSFFIYTLKCDEGSGQPVGYFVGSIAVACMLAFEPNGIVTDGPFCGSGKQLVK